MSDKYYFTGTRSQLLEKLEGFDKQAEFRPDEYTFVITVEDLGKDGDVPDDAKDLEQQPIPFTEETVKPASTETVEPSTGKGKK